MNLPASLPKRGAALMVSPWAVGTGGKEDQSSRGEPGSRSQHSCPPQRSESVVARLKAALERFQSQVVVDLVVGRAGGRARTALCCGLPRSPGRFHRA